MTDATGSGKRRNSQVRCGVAVSLAVASMAFAAGADDSAWVYDTSKREEPQVSKVASATGPLDGCSRSSDAGAVSTVDRKCCDSGASPETGLTSMPTGGIIIIR